MELKVLKSDLIKALQITQSAVAKKTTMPILVNFLLSTSNDHFRISAFDLEITALARVNGDIKDPGSTTVNARIFSDVVRELPDGEVSLILSEGQRLEIKAKGVKFKLNGVSAEEYPSLPGISLDVQERMQKSMLMEMIDRTIYAASQDETRFALSGACFEGKDKTLTVVATDGHRLAVARRMIEDLSFEGRVIIPRRGLSEIRKVLAAEETEEVGVALKDGYFAIQLPGSRLSVRLIDGEYPDYGRVFPKTDGVEVRMKGGDFAEALRRVMLVVSDKEKGARITISPNQLRISSSSHDLGEANEEVSVDYNGEVMNLSFNAAYLLDALLSFGEDKRILLKFHGLEGPAKFQIEGDESSTAIVMPMRDKK